jgi:kumamolisin
MQLPANYRLLAGSELKPAHGASVMGPAEPGEMVRLAVCVRQRPGAPPLPDHVHWMTTPPGKRRFLTSDEFAARHGAAAADIDAVVTFARGQGLTVLGTSPAGRTVRLSGTVEQMSRAFAVDLQYYSSPIGTYRSHQGPLSVPGDLADIVSAVFGAWIIGRPAAATARETHRELRHWSRQISRNSTTSRQCRPTLPVGPSV